MNASVLPAPVDVSFYPDYREMNPYQEMLYRAAGPGVRAVPLADTEALAALGREGSGILHLHWETAAFIRGEMSAGAMLDTLSAFRGRGGRIVWTMHNLMPHDAQYREAATQARNGLLDLADIVHLHSLPALGAAMELHAMPMGKVRIIAHGNYDGVYPVFDREAARAAMGLDNAEMVAVLPGQIRAYKAPGDLVSAFLEVAGAADRLILAGHLAGDAEGLSIPDDPRILAAFGFRSDEALAREIAAADFAVLPYGASLTSGSAILAQTLGRGVLGSDTPGLRDAVAMPSTGVLYDPEAKGALAAALSRALAEGPEVWARRGKAAAQASRARDWLAVGTAWRSVFSELAALSRTARITI